MGDLVPIYSAADALEAQLLREELEERGIEAWIINEALGGAMGEVPPGWSSNPRVVVKSDDAEKAREVAVTLERALLERRNAPREPQASIRPTIEPDDWPRCLMCGQRRLAVCRICGTSGTTFRPAFRLPDGPDNESPRMVVCSMCDEPFAPRYYRECEQCGYEFEDGIEVPRAKADPEQLREDLTRIWLMLGGILLLFVACGAYLWWVMQ